MHVAAGVECLLGPAAVRKAANDLGDLTIVFAGVLFVAGELGEQVELQGCAVVVGLRQLFDIVAAEALELQVADRGVDLQGVAVCLAEAGIVLLERVVLLAGLGIVLGVVEGVGVDLALCGGEGDAHGGKLGARLGGLGGEWLGEEEVPVERSGVACIAGHLVGAGKHIAEVRAAGLGRAGKRGEDAERARSVVLLEVEVGEQNGGGGDKDASGMAVGEAVEQAVGLAAVVGGQGGLRAEIVGVVAQGIAAAGGLAVGAGGFGKALIQHVGVAERKIGGGGSVAGVVAGVAEDAIVGGGGAGRGKLLCHGAELGGGQERCGEAGTLRGGGRAGRLAFRGPGGGPSLGGGSFATDRLTGGLRAARRRGWLGLAMRCLPGGSLRGGGNEEQDREHQSCLDSASGTRPCCLPSKNTHIHDFSCLLRPAPGHCRPGTLQGTRGARLRGDGTALSPGSPPG